MKREVLEKYKEYIGLCGNNEFDYMPDAFIKHIHSDYLDNGLIRLENPLYATWDITNYCNLNCVFCSASAKCHKGLVDEPNVEKIAQKIIDFGVKYVSIRGGEPMIVKQLPIAINLLVNAGIFVEIVSNGTGFNEQFFDSIKNCNKSLIRIKISLDSISAEKNNKIRGKGSYETALKSMENCKKYGWTYRVQMVVVNSNKNEIVDMYNLVREKGASSFGVYLVLPFGRGSRVEKVEIDEELLDQILYIQKNQSTTKFEKFALGLDDFRFFPYLYNEVNFDAEMSEKICLLKCNGGKTRINIDQNGDCYPCDLMKYKEFKMGNILKNSFNEIWNSDCVRRFNEIRRNNKKKCKTCKYKNCTTGCLAMNYSSDILIEEQLPNCEIS